jgi:hypothetical protein
MASLIPITITGLTLEGKVQVFTGTVQSVEKGYTNYARYSLRVTMPDANQGTRSSGDTRF